MAGVAAKQLIAAESGQHYFDVLGGFLCQQHERDGG